MNKLSKILTLLVISLTVSGCGMFKKIVTVPDYQEIQVVHPEPTPPPVLLNPKITATSATDLKKQLEAERPDSIFYVLTQATLDAILIDDVNKLEYSQRENKRANYYKKIIEDFNAKVKERNEEASGG